MTLSNLKKKNQIESRTIKNKFLQGQKQYVVVLFWRIGLLSFISIVFLVYEYLHIEVINWFVKQIYDNNLPPNQGLRIENTQLVW